MSNPTPVKPSEINVTATRPDKDNGTVEFLRRDITGQVEQRVIRVRYGGRSLLVLALIGAAITLISLNKIEWALFAVAVEALVLGQMVNRYRRDLRWITGYDPDSRKS